MEKEILIRELKFISKTLFDKSAFHEAGRINLAIDVLEEVLPQANVIKSVCEICADYEDGNSDNITCSKCKRKVRL